VDGRDYDPLLGTVVERLEKRPQSAPSGTRPGTSDKAETPTAPPDEDEAVRDASVAANLRDMTAAGFLHWIVSSLIPAELSAEGFKLYRDRLLQEAGNPSDPIEIMLIEQIALGHFAIGRLQMKACTMEVPKLSIAYSDAATRLLGEFRRCTQALEDFRAKQAARKERSTVKEVAKKTVSATRNGKPRPSTNGKKPSTNGKKPSTNGKKPSTNRKKKVNGKKMAMTTELTTNGEIPECLRERMGFAASDVLKPTAAIGANGKG
jgi:hypothetical protein